MRFLFIRITWLALGEQETLLISGPRVGLLHCCASQVQISWVLLTLTPAQNTCHGNPNCRDWALPGACVVCVCRNLQSSPSSPSANTSKADGWGEKRQNNCSQLWCNIFTYMSGVFSKSWQVTEGKTVVCSDLSYS